MPGGGRTLKEGASEGLSLRQLGVTAFAAGVSVLPAGAGLGWRGAALALPLLLAAGWGLWALLPRWPSMASTPWGRGLAALYALWGTVLLGAELRRCALRVLHTGGADPAHLPWLIGLLALPLLWMAWGKGAALFRAAELYYLIVGVCLSVLLGWFLLRGEWSRAVSAQGSAWQSGLTLAAAAGSFLFVLPCLRAGWPRSAPAPRRGMGWLALLGLAGVLLPFGVAGVLGGPLAGQAPFPVLLTAGALGGSARPESLVCMLWLFADYARLGLLARSWAGGRGGRSRWAVAGAAAGTLAALWPAMDRITPVETGVGTVLLALLTALALLGQGKIVEEKQG